MGNKKSNIEFITNGNITDVIFKLSIPLMISNLIKTLYGITDGIYVARISSEDYAATSFTWPVLYLFIAVGLGVSVAATSLMSQRLGARKLKDCSVYAVHTLILTTVLGVIFSILGVITAPFIVRWMGATGSFEYKSYIFLAINSVGLLFDMIFFGYQSILNSQGRTKSMTIISTISSITNVVIDPFFIFDNVLGIPGLNMGLAGAAWATVISKVLLVVFAIRVVKKESEIEVSFKNFKLDMGIIKHIFSIAIPASLGSSGEAIGFTVLNGFIQSYGTTTLAAFSMGNRLSDIFNQGAIGIGMALTSITGQNIGAGKKERSKDIFKRANIIITFFSLASAIIILLFKDQLLSIFIKDRSDLELWRQASEYMYFSAIITFFMGYFSAINGFFQGVGKTKLTMYLSLARLWVLRLPLIMILKSLTDLGSTGIWISMLVSNALTVIVGFIIYKRGRWER
ncbi:MAG: MATE family efflux transporter [Finegoldia magna]|uniref:MATE family efflux transporter n=1 Tax=Finegoldia magna TaxID=1260 RepID=UPI001CE0F2D4|nr:MATE family efflux transporter [Finegoldia magna]MCA5586681.1 MATE family efflux transporter [Finegoldia magna]MDU5214711.1 MATE family efflux transporter [Finegoldia magna]MDU5273466.1 MATE family efflux transporter [Finegoldia magna]